MKEKKIVVIGTNYSFLISLLLLDKKESFYIFCNKIDKKIYSKLNTEAKYYSKVYVENKNLKGIILYYYNYIKVQILLKKFKKNTFYINDYLIETCFLKEAYLLEDGTSNYLEEKKIKKNLISLLRLDFRGKTFGYSSKIKKIFLTGLAPLPNKLEKKVEIINLYELWSKKTKTEQKEILDIFGLTPSILKIFSKRKIILFTQPLSEDKIITEEEKINIYSKIVENYSKKEMILKTHPREVTDYKKYFPDLEVLDLPIPYELLQILKVEPEIGITLFSTAALRVSKRVDFYGTEVHPKIFKAFGNCDKIMKRNKILLEEDYV